MLLALTVFIILYTYIHTVYKRLASILPVGSFLSLSAISPTERGYNYIHIYLLVNPEFVVVGNLSKRGISRQKQTQTNKQTIIREMHKTQYC
jgi:hypothetical protein